jgi:hypothetical protein
MTKKPTLKLLLCLMVASILYACGGSDSPTSAPTPTPTTTPTPTPTPAGLDHLHTHGTLWLKTGCYKNFG